VAYSIHIERHNDAGQREPIETDEWIEAVSATNGVRMLYSDATASNPVTHDNIVIKPDGAGAELYDEQRDIWLPVFRWTKRGSVSFEASPDFDEAESRLRIAAGELALKLSARLVGDEGEFYS